MVVADLSLLLFSNKRLKWSLWGSLPLAGRQILMEMHRRVQGKAQQQSTRGGGIGQKEWSMTLQTFSIS